MHFCGGKNKYNVRRRLLKRFEQCIESVGREHMDLVYYINPVFRDGRGKVYLLAQLTDIVNAVV